ncbi:MAG TPA: response regulator [Ktedonobacteraceae bacterium]|nr:response regulator [Ktedonobacteraceae bacterium]
MTSKRPPSKSNQEANNQTILLVEDDEDISVFMTQILTDETPYEALRVPDATSALEVVDSIKPSLFILDYRLPGLNGLELSDRLHSIEGLETVPTMMISANYLPRNELQRRHITYLKKPFDLSHLLTAVEKLLAA